MRFENLQALSDESIKALRDWSPSQGFTGVDLVHPISLIRCEAQIFDIARGTWRKANDGGQARKQLMQTKPRKRRAYGPAKRSEGPSIRKPKFEGPTT